MKIIKVIISTIFLALLAGCSHDKPLQAPCTYYARSGCGPEIPLVNNR